MTARLGKGGDPFYRTFAVIIGLGLIVVGGFLLFLLAFIANIGRIP
jgi:uncharacterized surface anchored protein